MPGVDLPWFTLVTRRTLPNPFARLRSISRCSDVTPGSFPNSIDLKSNGVIPEAILTMGTFDATTGAPLSIRFGPKGAKEAHNRGHIEDVNHDRDPDLVLHFKTQATGITDRSIKSLTKA